MGGEPGLPPRRVGGGVAQPEYSLSYAAIEYHEISWDIGHTTGKTERR